MKAFLTAGHQVLNGKGNGAKGVIEERTGKPFDEALEARLFVDAVIAHQRRWYKLETLTDCDSTSLSQLVRLQAATVDENWLCIDVHFNAGPPAATGTENYISRNYIREELSVASMLANAQAEALKLKLRKGVLGIPGVKLENESQHPRLAILSTPAKAINILVELCFITNIGDVRKYRENFNDLVKAFSDVIGNYRLGKA